MKTQKLLVIVVSICLMAFFNVSSFEQTTSVQPDDVQPDMTTEDRYYTKDEYKKLTQAQRKVLRLKREKRGHVSGAKRPATKISNKSIKAIASALKGCDLDEDEVDKADSGSDSESEKPPKCMKGGKNRHNKALSRSGKQ